MNRSATRFTSALSVGVFFVTVHSGLLKWIPIGGDLTFLSGGLLALGLVSMFLFNSRGARPIADIVGSVLLFLLVAGLSAVYTVSEVYWQRKLLGMSLAVACFLFPIFGRHKFFRDDNDLQNVLNMLTCVIGGFVVYHWFRDGLFTLIYARQGHEYLPNYLNLSEFMGIIILLNALPNRTSHILALAGGAFCLALLGGRGPALGVVLGFIVRLYFERRRIKSVGRILSIGLAVVTAAVVLNSQSAERLVGRMGSLFQEGSDGVFSRLEHWSFAVDLASSYPIGGIGIGGYGLAYFGDDSRAYPHNIILESAAEFGIPITFILVFVLLKAVFLGFRSAFTSTGAKYLSVILYIYLQYSKSGSLGDARVLLGWMGIVVGFWLYQRELQRAPQVGQRV